MASLFVLAAIVVMTLAQAAQAAPVPGTALNGGTAASGEPTIRPVVPGSFTLTRPQVTRFELSGSTPGSARTVATASAPTSGTSATSALIVAAGLVGGLLIVLWAFARGRIRRREAGFDCEATLLGC